MTEVPNYTGSCIRAERNELPLSCIDNRFPVIIDDPSQSASFVTICDGFLWNNMFFSTMSIFVGLIMTCAECLFSGIRLFAATPEVIRLDCNTLYFLHCQLNFNEVPCEVLSLKYLPKIVRTCALCDTDHSHCSISEQFWQILYILFSMHNLSYLSLF